MTKLTKHDTILWINHAIANFKGLGKNQKDLAGKLGIEPERLSEMKSGKGTISPNLMEKIVDLCGAPRRNPGRFEYAETYNDLESFFNEFDSVTENRFYRKLLKTLTSEKYISVIINECELENVKHENMHECDINSLKLERINQLIHTPDFVVICHQYHNHLIAPNGSRSFNSGNAPMEQGRLKMAGLLINNSYIFHCIYLIWLLTDKFPGFRFGDKTPFNLNPIRDLSPVVMTGKRILTIQSDHYMELAINKKAKETFGHSYRYPKLNDNNSPFGKTDDKKTGPQPDQWNDLRCEVYLSENMNYHFLIHLSHNNITYKDHDNIEIDVEHNDREPIVKTSDRVAVITNVPSLDLFRQIEELRKWYGLPIDNHYEIKQKIAEAGGYVPGAKVLV